MRVFYDMVLFLWKITTQWIIVWVIISVNLLTFNRKMKENKLVYLIRYIPTITVVLFSIIVFSLSVNDSYRRTNQEITHIESDIVEEKKDSKHLWVAAQAGWFLVHSTKGVITRFSAESNADFKIPTNDIYYTYQDCD